MTSGATVAHSGAGRIDVDRRSLGRYFDALFARLDAVPDERLHVAECAVGGVRFKLRCSDADLLALYLQRLVPSEPMAGPAFRIDVIAAEDMGWPAARWADPISLPEQFEQPAREAGYTAIYPHVYGQWHARQLSTGNCLFFLPRVSDRVPWDGGAPLRLELNWTFHTPRRRMMHAGSLGLDGNGVLLVGRGGAGKSGTTLAGIAGGLTTVGDDYLLIDQSAAPRVLPLYRILKQDPAGVARVVGLSGRFACLAPNWQGKYEFDPDALFPGCLAGGLTLQAIVMPTIAGAPRSTFEPVSRHEALKFLAAASREELPSPHGDSVLFFAGLTGRLPVYRLHLSRDPAEIAAAVRAFLDTGAPCR